tara:strand:+ start:5865 stop:6092 length:228 start_codon:yes stop_codon:yes gene_type:complete
MDIKYFYYFLASFLFGLLFIYISESPKKIVLVHPTPDNQQYFQYKDKANNCFEYEYVESKCPFMDHNVKTIPVEL